MEIKIECPWCNQHYSVDESFIGQAVECAVCKKEFTVRKPNDLGVLLQPKTAANFPTQANNNRNHYQDHKPPQQPQTRSTQPPYQQPFIQQQYYPQEYTGSSQQYPQQVYNTYPQGYQQQGYNVPPQGYPPPGYGIPPQAPFPGEYKPKSRIAYIIWGIILGLWGGHDFYAGLEPRGFVHLGCAFVTIACAFFVLEGLRLFLLMANGVWTLAEIIVVNKDGNGVRMK